MRTFIAIDLPPSIRHQLIACQEMLIQRVDAAGIDHAVRWVPAEKVHLTLRFLGETSAVQSTAVNAALASIAASQLRFDLRVNGVGGFPNLRRPAVVWLGINGDLAALNALQAQIEAAVCAAGFQPEQRAYSPHLTIGRVQRNANSYIRSEVGATIQNFDRPIPTTSFSVDHITHVRSVLEPAGAVYTPLAQFPF